MSITTCRSGYARHLNPAAIARPTAYSRDVGWIKPRSGVSTGQMVDTRLAALYPPYMLNPAGRACPAIWIRGAK
ncbi:MAG: hypothetical protein WB870_17360 [Gallionellaceae bacterium]